MTEDKAVIFSNVNKVIKKREILNNISFDVKRGEIVGIIGSNGSGKTTILRLASGLSYATSGDIYISNQKIEVGKVGGLPQNVGILIESPKFLEHLTGFENLDLLSKIQGKINSAKIREVLELVGLNPNDKKKVREYSLGMKQRLGIAQTTMEEPNLILFDEPTNGLDKEGLEIFEKIIYKCKERGTAFIFVSHSMEEIKKYCDRVFKIENKTLVLQQKNYEWRILLNNLEDAEKILQFNTHAYMGQRYQNKPVIVIPFRTKKELIDLLDLLNIQYTILKDDQINDDQI